MENIPIRETEGEEQNKTMVDGSINSVSQGKSINQSSGKNQINLQPANGEDATGNDENKNKLSEKLK